MTIFIRIWLKSIILTFNLDLLLFIVTRLYVEASMQVFD